MLLLLEKNCESSNVKKLPSLHPSTPPPPPSLQQYGTNAGGGQYNYPGSGLLIGILGGGGAGGGGAGNLDMRVNYLDPQTMQQGQQRQQDPQMHSFSSLSRNAPLSFQDKVIHPPGPGSSSASSLTPSVERRIVNIISMFHQGVSGTQLLEIYYREYGEELGLTGRRLQDAVSG